MIETTPIRHLLKVSEVLEVGVPCGRPRLHKDSALGRSSKPAARFGEHNLPAHQFEVFKAAILRLLKRSA
jgi:hypothetical protein